MFAITTLIGLVGGIACIVAAIFEGGNLGLFINIPSFLIIVGGTCFALIMAYPFSTLKTLGAVIKQAFVQDRYDPIEVINTIIELSMVARREGLLAIERYMENIDNHFLKKGLNLLVDGIDREDLEATMMNEIYQAQKRHRVGASMISMIASVAPGLGLVGTYVGLIPMLVHMRDPEKLGPLMAIELVSSFYGGFMANVIFSPMARKLQSKSTQEKDIDELMLQGILGLHEGKNPRVLREDLLTYLTKEKAVKVAHTNRMEHADGRVIEIRESKTK